MVVIKTMVGEIEVDDSANWGDQDNMTAAVKSPLDSSSNIRVVVRVRPPNQREMALAGGIIIEVTFALFQSLTMKIKIKN